MSNLIARSRELNAETRYCRSELVAAYNQLPIGGTGGSTQAEH